MQAKEKLSDFAHDKLKEMILNNTFKPGEHLEEAALCDMLKISRTPLREAINRLVNEHLLIAVPQKGIFIPDLSIQDVTEIFRARKMFEPMIIMLSADKMDRDVLMKFRQDTLALLEKQDIKALHDLDYKFHGYINASCGNHFIYQYTVLINFSVSEPRISIRSNGQLTAQRNILSFWITLSGASMTSFLS